MLPQLAQINADNKTFIRDKFRQSAGKKQIQNPGNYFRQLLRSLI